MKKKSARKISGVKKVSAKSPNKKTKFSLKAWLLGGLVILIALAYSYSNSQPKSYKVIELSGKAEDYIKPAPVDINLINNTVKGPISDTPEVNAIAAAAQAKKIAKEAGKSDEQANQAAKIAANQAVKQTYQSNAAAGVMTNADAQKALNVKVKSADGTEKTEAEKAAEYATNYVQNNINIVPKTDETTGTTSYSIQIQPNYGSQVNTEGQCETSNGGSVYAGSTVIGSSDRVYRCTSTGWQATDTYCVASKMDIKDCPVSVKPSYALPTGKANCYSGSVIIGQDQVVDTKDGKRVCDNGALIQPKKINGQIVTPDKYEEILKDQQNKCVNNGGSWTQTGGTTGEYYCGKANSKTCSDIGKVFSEATQGCVVPGSAGDKADTKKTTPYSKAGCDNARDENKEDCIQSADNPLLWVIVPKGTKPSVNSGVPAKVSSEVNSNKIANTYTSKECEDAAKNNPGYTCEPIAGGTYYKLTPTSELPATQRPYANAPGEFGGNAPAIFTPTPDVSKQGYLTPEKCKQQYRVDCLQIGAGSWYPPTTPTVSNNSTIVDRSRPTSQYPNAGKECDGTMAYSDGNGGYTSTPSCSQLCGGAGSYPENGKLICSNGGISTTTNPASQTANSITCPSGSTEVGGTCVAENLNPEFMKRKDGEACTNKRNCEETCDGEYVAASVKKPGNLFASNSYYCGNEEVVNKLLSEAGNPYSIKSTTQLAQDSLENDPTVKARLAEMKEKIVKSGNCDIGNIDQGIRVICKDGTKEPIFEFCDGGHGSYDSEGICTPSRPVVNTTNIENPNAGKNAAIVAVGLGGGCLAAAALVGMGTAPLAVITAPATLAICGGFTVIGGRLGASTP